MAGKKNEAVVFGAPTKSLTETAKKELLDTVVESSMKNIDTTFVETGNIGFDLEVSNGLGLPEGSSILFWATPGVGKTTLIGDVCKRLLDEAKRNGKPYKILYIADENSKDLLKALGLEPYMASKDLLYLYGQTNWRKVELYYDAVLKGYKDFKGVKVIIIDSVNNVLSDSNLEKSSADGDFGTRARERSNFYSKYLPICSEKGVTSIFISQARKKQDATMYEDQNKAAVTQVDLHNVEVIIKCSKKVLSSSDGQVLKKTAFGDVKDQKRYVLKLDSTPSNCKNRFYQGLLVEVLVVKGKGIDNTYTLRKLLEFYKYLKNASGWFTFSEGVAKLIGIDKEKKLRVSQVNELLRAHMGTLIGVLKEAGQYKLDADEEDLAEEETFENTEDFEGEEDE